MAAHTVPAGITLPTPYPTTKNYAYLIEEDLDMVHDMQQEFSLLCDLVGDSIKDYVEVKRSNLSSLFWRAERAFQSLQVTDTEMRKIDREQEEKIVHELLQNPLAEGIRHQDLLRMMQEMGKPGMLSMDEMGEIADRLSYSVERDGRYAALQEFWGDAWRKRQQKYMPTQAPTTPSTANVPKERKRQRTATA